MLKNKKQTVNAIAPAFKGEIFSQEWLSEVIAHIAGSPIANQYKAMFLYTIAKGTVDLELYEMYISLLAEHRNGLEKRRAELEEQMKKLEEDQMKTKEELSKAAVGACREIAAAFAHVEKKTLAEAEKATIAHSEKEAKAIRERILKPKKQE